MEQSETRAHLGPVEAVAERRDARKHLLRGLTKGLDDRVAQLLQQEALQAPHTGGSEQGLSRNAHARCRTNGALILPHTLCKCHASNKSHSHPV